MKFSKGKSVGAVFTVQQETIQIGLVPLEEIRVKPKIIPFNFTIKYAALHVLSKKKMKALKMLEYLDLLNALDQLDSNGTYVITKQNKEEVD